MNYTRLLLIMRWVVTPIVIAIIAGYFQVRVNVAKEQTRATYETLAPMVGELEKDVLVLQGRVDELSKRPVYVEAPAARPSARPRPVERPSPFAGGVTEPMMDKPEPPPAQLKMPPKFDDMLQQRTKY